MNRHNVINETTKSLNKWCCLGWEEHPRGRPPGGAGGRQGGQYPHPQGRKINTFEIHIIYLCNYMFNYRPYQYSSPAQQNLKKNTF